MSGGSGTRLWPMSRQNRPKQFLKLVTDKSMFQETVLRVSPEVDPNFEPPVVIAGAKHGPVITEEFRELDMVPGDIILEPCARNTAAVAAVASAWVARHDDDALILLMPADHHIPDGEGFRAAIAKAVKAAEDGYIAIFGIKPTRPHTGYGYIQTGEALSDSVYKAAAFREKPDRKTAEAYLADGRHYWNAGIFLFRASAMLEELKNHAPEIKSAAIAALDKSVMSGAAIRLDEDAFSPCPSNSLDYAVMEKTAKAAIVAPVDVGWTDIGSWSEVETQPQGRNVVVLGGAGNIIRTEGPLVAAAGVSDLIIIAVDDAVLVAPRDNAQAVREIVEELKKRGREDLL